MPTELYESLCEYLKSAFASDSSGHDYYHTIRVYNNAMQIADGEACDRRIVMLAALLHDVDDAKLFSTVDYENARRAMRERGVSKSDEKRVIDVIKTVSFKGKDSVVPATIEGKIVQDADRLDAIGAIGIARAFAYGGSRGRAMYDPDVKPALNMDKDAYLNNKGTTINHFYEKLLLLNDMLCTKSAKRIAAGRREYMQGFLDEFYGEWNGER